MFSFFSNMKIRKISHIVFVKIVERSRMPCFYVDYNVEDNLDGRFDLICLHMTLIIDRLDMINSKKSIAVRRILQEVFFDNMDLSLREMGVGDLSVGKKIKVMAEAFFGRMIAYQKAYRTENAEEELSGIILRNFFHEDFSKNDNALMLAKYTLNERKFTAKISEELLLKGKFEFSPL